MSESLEVENYLNYVEALARIYKRHIPDVMELDELISYGFIGLKAAIDKYDSKSNACFKTYAHHKIMSAMRDGFRAWNKPYHNRSRNVKRIDTVPYIIAVSNHELPDAELERSITCEAIRKAMKVLDEREKSIILDCDFRYIKQDIVAKKWNLTINGIQYVRRKAFAKMRIELESLKTCE